MYDFTTHNDFHDVKKYVFHLRVNRLILIHSCLRDSMD